MTDSNSVDFQFVQFCTTAEVFYLGYFWHVHINAKKPIGGDVIFNALALSNQNPSLPIRVSTALNDGFLWAYKGKLCNPYGDIYHVFTGDTIGAKYEPRKSGSRLIADYVNIKTGRYVVRWDAPGQYEKGRHADHYTSSVDSARHKWETVRPTEQSVIGNAFNPNDTVRYYDTIDTHWTAKTDSLVLERSEPDEPTSICDVGVYERGSAVDGNLQLVRVSKKRLYHWARNISNEQPDDSSLPTQLENYHRGNGPARVELEWVKEVITDKTSTTTYHGNYKRQWYRGGKEITGTQMQEWARNNKIIIIDHPCHDRPAFPNPMDRVSWLGS